MDVPTLGFNASSVIFHHAADACCTALGLELLLSEGLPCCRLLPFAWLARAARPCPSACSVNSVRLVCRPFFLSLLGSDKLLLSLLQGVLCR